MDSNYYINNLGNVMKLPKNASAQVIELWQPRYHDKVMLIAKWRIRSHNIIKVTKSNAYNGEYYVSGEVAAKCPIEKVKDKTGTERLFYVIPIDLVEPYEGRVE